ncbi:MAG: DnaJ domain-containing protein [Candidatus Doudnabacteria bacterium]|nr:DnaJ domain-containing protein [Candidatus Doudnabacteria bacterium]
MPEREKGYSPEEKYKNQTYYELLGLTPETSDEEIKTAFVNLSKKYHPDRGGDLLRYQFITEAYTTLKDPNKRRAYNIRINASHPNPKGGRPRRDATTDWEEAEKRTRSAYEESHKHFQEGGQDPFERLRKKREEIDELLRRKREEYLRTRDSTKTAQQSNEGRQNVGLRTRKVGNRFYFINANGRESVYSYDSIEERSGVVVGRTGRREYLIDRNTGEGSTYSYDQIFERGGIWIGRNGRRECVITNKRSGESSIYSYDEIMVKNGVPIGKIGRREYLLNKNTGESSVWSYDEILVRDDILIGRNGSSEYLLDRNSGESISYGFKKIERRNHSIIGINPYREEVIG